MDGLSKKLTEKDVTEALSQRKELLECYRQRLAMLSNTYIICSCHQRNNQY